MDGGGLSWGRFEWRAGVDSYSFEIDTGGLYATLKVPNAPAMKLPVVAWEGLIEAVKTSHKARTKSQSAQPPRAGSRWSDEETADLARGFESGSSVAELARRHSRSAWAVESHLVRLGLLQRADALTSSPRGGNDPGARRFG